MGFHMNEKKERILKALKTTFLSALAMGFLACNEQKDDKDPYDFGSQVAPEEINELLTKPLANKSVADVKVDNFVVRTLKMQIAALGWPRMLQAMKRPSFR